VPNYDAGLGPAILRLIVSEGATNTGSNSSTVHIELHLICTNRQSWSNNPVSWNLNVNGYAPGGTFTFDFRSSSDKLIFAADINVVHDSDGRKTIHNTASIGSTGTSIPAGSLASDTALSGIAPSPPGTPAATLPDSSTFRWTWGDNLGSSPQRWEIQMALNSAFTNGVTAVKSTDTRSFNWGGIPPATRYYARVRAVNASGASNWSGVGTAVSGSSPTNAPGTPTVGVVTPNSMRVAWTAPTDNNGDAPDSYQLQWATNSQFSNATVVTSTGTGLTLNSLPPSTTIYLRVRSKNGAGYSAWSGSRSQTTLPADPPSIIVATPPSGRSAIVSITPPQGISGITRYLVSFQDLAAGTTTVVENGTPTVTVSPLQPGRRYTFTATFKIGAYQSPSSAPQTVTLPAPSTNPGAYFDGSTAASPDQKYQWTGGADLSILERVHARHGREVRHVRRPLPRAAGLPERRAVVGGHARHPGQGGVGHVLQLLGLRGREHAARAGRPRALLERHGPVLGGQPG
jgi:hypothetical protein